MITGIGEKTEKLLSEFGETDLKEINPQARGWLLSLQAWIANNHDQPSAVPLAEKALEVIQANDLFNRAITHILIGHNHFRRGKMAQAIQAYRAAASLGWESRAYLALVTAVDSLALTMNECGQRQEALTVLQDSADNLVDHKGRTLPIADMLSISRSVLAYENNQLPLAIALAHKGQWAGRRFLSQQVMGAEAENILVQAYAAQEDYSSANAVIEEARRLGSGLGWISSILDALQAHLFYVQGHLKGVEEWARQANISPDSGITPHCELCYLTYGRLLLVQERYREAGQFLNQISVKAKHTGRNAILISLLILEARCLQGQGEKPGAQKKMASALKLAAPEGYLRRFLNESGYILDILRDCQGDRDFQADLSLNSYINELLQTISGNSLEIISQSPSVSKSRLIEPLTNQELTVLRLLSSGLSNQEISDELVIGMSTTKWHLHNIYGKLGVKNRTSAIVKAQNLALI